MTQASKVRVRFAPSPTGFLHIGGARTALFNYLYAKKHQGSFILRIEDTDRERSTPEAVEAILDGLTWLGLNWDEGPFFQTERQSLYQKELERLLESGKAYRCYCSPQELDQMRESLKAQGKKPMYDGRCKHRKDAPSDQAFVIRFAVPEGQTRIEDLVKGPIDIAHREIEDLVIARSDGTPTYNFVVVVDDHEMRMTHVIRGDDHLANTPKQILLGEALDYDLPQYAHLPLILGKDKTRLSKRHGATAVQMYRDQGYFPHSIINFLARLGWSHKDQEIFSLEELIEKFDLDAVGTSPGVFNEEKLLWLNQHYIKDKPYKEVIEGLGAFIEIRPDQIDDPKSHRTIEVLRDRAKTLKELAELAAFHFSDQITPDPELKKKLYTDEVKDAYQDLILEIENNSFEEADLEKSFSQVLKTHGLKFPQLGKLVRLALAGGPFGPGVFELFEIVGKERSIQRLRALIG
ncbi:MAG: glutamate--tRNA ligase [Bdellovibrionales bacterium]|nr:glutamate--tRNA ligase [Bdellovibrionales bacterium]